MSPGRLHPAERRAQADLELALALSRSQALPPPLADSQPPPPTKYGTLIGGTLDNSSAAQTSQLAGSHGTAIVCSSSDQVHLLKRLPPVPTHEGLGKYRVPSTYPNTSASSASAAKLLVQETPSTHSSARDSTGMNPLAGGVAVSKPFGDVNMTAVEEDTSGEFVIADSDGEEAASARLSLSSQSVAPVAGPSRFNIANNPFPIAPPANTTFASSSIHDTTTSSLPRPTTAANTTSTDPIVTSTSAASGPSCSRSSKYVFAVEIDSPARSRTTSKKSSSSEKKKSAWKEKGKGKGKKRAVVESEQEEEDDSRRRGEPDYEQPPITKAKVPKRQRTSSIKVPDERVLSKETVDSEDDEDEIILASTSSKNKRSTIVDEEEDDPLAIPGSVLQRPSSTSTGGRLTASTSAACDDADSRPAKKSRKSSARSEAVSEDEDGQKRLAEEIAFVNERVEEADSDFGTGGKAKKGKKKQAAPKKRQKKDAEGDKPKLRRVPTVKKASIGASETQVVPETPADPVVTAGAESSAAAATNSVEQDDAVMVDADQSAEEAQEGGEAEEPVAAKKKKADKGKKKAVVQDSEEEDAEPAVVVASKDVPASPSAAGAAGPTAKAKKDKGKAKAKTTPAQAKKGRRKKNVVPAPDDEQDGVRGEATSAIHTGDESPFDDDEEPVARKKGKALGKERAAAKEVDNSPACIRSSRAASAAARSVSPAVSRASGNRRSLEDRMEAVTKAAQEEDDSFIAAEKNGAAKRKVKRKTVVEDDKEADDEDEAEEKNVDPPSPASSEAKENKGVANAGPSRGTPQQVQRGRSSIGTPGTRSSKPHKPGSLAAIMAKHGLATFRPPGLSNRAKLPPLHTNLKPAPPPKKILKEEKPKKKKKKGDESYSDEEKPWWETKDPEEWDSDDHRRWQKRQRRIERGLPADSDDD
ncbi:hypothetical protein JCM10295v2_001565 [Rhodotorula toruloides]